MSSFPIDDAKKIGAEFLLSDLELALTFLDAARVTGSEEIARRNRENARRAYLDVQRLLDGLQLIREDYEAVQSKLAMLKDRLASVGYPV